MKIRIDESNVIFWMLGVIALAMIALPITVNIVSKRGIDCGTRRGAVCNMDCLESDHKSCQCDDLCGCWQRFEEKKSYEFGY